MVRWLAGVGPLQLRDNLPAGCVGPGLFRAPWKRARGDDVVAEEHGPLMWARGGSTPRCVGGHSFCARL